MLFRERLHWSRALFPSSKWKPYYFILHALRFLIKFLPLHILPLTTTMAYPCNLYDYETNLPSVIIKFV